MNYTQNEKIEQVTDSTMVVGVDIGSQIHYARAFDNRGRELIKRVFSFHNDLEGFNSFNLWAETLKTENKKTAVLIGCEPTGHYWFAFAKYVNDHQKRLEVSNYVDKSRVQIHIIRSTIKEKVVIFWLIFMKLNTKYGVNVAECDRYLVCLWISNIRV